MGDRLPSRLRLRELFPLLAILSPERLSVNGFSTRLAQWASASERYESRILTRPRCLLESQAGYRDKVGVNTEKKWCTPESSSQPCRYAAEQRGDTGSDCSSRDVFAESQDVESAK
jgi:hypothetical protein